MFLSSPFNLIRTPWLRAAGVLFSTIVGAGMLSIPFVIAQVGLVIGFFYIIGMGLVMCMVHLALGEIVIHTRRHLQLTGLIRKYVGPFGVWIMAIVFLILHMGAMVAYLIGEGESLSTLLGGPPLLWTIIFFLCGTVIIIRGTKAISQFDFWMSILTLVVVGVLVGLSMPATVHGLYVPEHAASFFLPFGVLLFAFHGTSAIPELEMITGSDATAFRKAVIVGSLVPIILYLVFAGVVVAVTGADTTQIATIGLGNAVGPRVILIGNIFAVIAMSSSFVTIGQALRRTFQWDYGWHHSASLLAAVGLPFVMYALGAREFVQVIAVVGATCGSVEICLLLLAYWRMNSSIKMSYEESGHPRRRIRRG